MRWFIVSATASSRHREEAHARAMSRFFVVLQGTGDIITGGKLVNEKRVNAANLTGSDIADGQTHHVVKGDVLIVPNNTPHQVIPGGGAPIVLMTMHVPMPAPANWP
jgi:mannose-6-phosphate isomerase-like protein (cupin superfamily)